MMNHRRWRWTSVRTSAISLCLLLNTAACTGQPTPALQQTVEAQNTRIAQLQQTPVPGAASAVGTPHLLLPSPSQATRSPVREASPAMAGRTGQQLPPASEGNPEEAARAEFT